EAIDILGKARAANSRIWYPHLYLAGAFGLRGDMDAAKAALAASLKLKPEINSLAHMRTYNDWITNRENWALQEATLNVGLRRAGLPDEYLELASHRCQSGISARALTARICRRCILRTP